MDAANVPLPAQGNCEARWLNRFRLAGFLAFDEHDLLYFLRPLLFCPICLHLCRVFLAAQHASCN